MKYLISKRIIFAFILVALAIIISGCFPGGQHPEWERPAGFLMGIWHGWIAPLSLIISIFDHSIRVYETYNTGWWYDFGFYIAIIAGFGSISLVRKKKEEKQ